MSWELHLTVVGASGALEAFAASVGARRLELELDEDGARHVEEMMTLRVPEGVDAARAAAERLARGACERGITVLRSKVEAPVDTTVPALYLEHHVRVRFSPPSLAALASIATRHEAHLSRRPRKQETDHEERYLTARFGADEGAREAAALEALVRALANASFEITKVERERIVLDHHAEAP
ncbi:MAG: hypothetical protein HOO96_03535 [Polyangiaceae bacterium]|nr:hypothetical protein [Polyangiaceae bacterium]